MTSGLFELLFSATGLIPWQVGVLVGVSFSGSFLTAAMGIGGGGLVLATMAMILPPTVLIPIHGVVQLGSNIGRTALMFKSIYREIVPAFIVGTILGAIIGGRLVIALPLPLLQIVLALFILYTTWAPKMATSNPGRRTFFGVGLVGTFLTMFVGATGPLVAGFVAAACKQRQQVVATHALLMSIQHGLKVLAFGVLGFAFGPYLPLLAAMLAFGFIGTYVGKHVLTRLPEQIFRTGLKIILTLIALRLLYGALRSFT